MQLYSRLALPVIVITLILVSVNLTGSDNNMNADAAREDLMAVDRQFSQLSAAEGRAAAFEAYMDDSATVLRDNAHPFVGREAIREMMARSPQGTLTWEPHFAAVAESGDLGYTYGHWEYTETDDAGKERKSLGHYVTIWRKQPDGNWKVVLDTGTEGPPPEKW